MIAFGGRIVFFCVGKLILGQIAKTALGSAPGGSGSAGPGGARPRPFLTPTWRGCLPNKQTNRTRNGQGPDHLGRMLDHPSPGTPPSSEAGVWLFFSSVGEPPPTPCWNPVGEGSPEALGRREGRGANPGAGGCVIVGGVGGMGGPADDQKGAAAVREGRRLPLVRGPGGWLTIQRGVVNSHLSNPTRTTPREQAVEVDKHTLEGGRKNRTHPSQSFELKFSETQ